MKLKRGEIYSAAVIEVLNKVMVVGQQAVFGHIPDLGSVQIITNTAATTLGRDLVRT